jgi:hypothetical protein
MVFQKEPFVSEIHPPIDFAAYYPITDEEKIAQDVFSILLSGSNETDSVIDDYMFHALETDAIDLESKHDGFVSLRIKTLPSLMVMNGEDGERSADPSRYYVMDIEQREAKKGDVSWNPYVRIVVDTLLVDEEEEPCDPGDPLILNGRTFEQLDPMELNVLGAVVKAMLETSRDTLYNEAVREYALVQASRMRKVVRLAEVSGETRTLVDFDSTDFMQTNSCGHAGCGTENQACGHDPRTAN